MKSAKTEPALQPELGRLARLLGGSEPISSDSLVPWRAGFGFSGFSFRRRVEQAKRIGQRLAEREERSCGPLGILSAIGGFVDIGDFVFNTQAGATFGFQLMWVVVIGVVGMIVYSDTCGRVSAVSKRPVFDLIRERTGFGAGFNAGRLRGRKLITCAAEVGGVAICLQLLSGLPYRVLILLGVMGLVVSSWVLPFEWIERVFGYLGYLFACFCRRSDQFASRVAWVADGFLPGSHSGGSLLVYLYLSSDCLEQR